MGWHRALALVVVGLLGIAASCGNGKKSQPEATSGGGGGGVVTAIDAAATTATKPPNKWACTTADDCVISCELRGNCCAQGCQCNRVYHRDQQEEIRKANVERCAVMDVECKQYDCKKETYDLEAVCVDGTCDAKRVPLSD